MHTSRWKTTIVWIRTIVLTEVSTETTPSTSSVSPTSSSTTSIVHTVIKPVVRIARLPVPIVFWTVWIVYPVVKVTITMVSLIVPKREKYENEIETPQKDGCYIPLGHSNTTPYCINKKCQHNRPKFV